MKKIKKTPSISVIIPVYNTGKQIHKGIRSLLNQSFQDFELILLNDGSTDEKTIEICKEYEKQDLRIRYFSKINEGIEITRKKGIDLANAPYVVHMDHDDWYSKDALEILYTTALANDVDIVVAQNYDVYPLFNFFNVKIKYRSKVAKIEIVDQKEYRNKYFINFFGVNMHAPTTWAKMYKKSLFDTNDMITLGHNMTEDVVFNIQVFPKAKRIAFISDYIYFHKFGGLTSTKKPFAMLENYSDLYQLKQKCIRKFNFEKAYTFINYEMKNVFAQVITEIIESNLLTKKGVVAFLQDYSKSETYQELKLFYSTHNIQDAFSLLIINDDFEKMYEVQEELDLKLRIKIKFKRLIIKYIIN